MFSLIVATLGRTDELIAFLESLVAQSERNFEVIVVDQNHDERLEPVIARFEDKFPLRHLRSPIGLSRARNCGLAVTKGDLVAFPDDDCIYPPDLLADVRSHLQRYTQLAGITCVSRDGSGLPSGPRWLKVAGAVTKEKVWRQAVSYTIFLRRSAVEAIGPFDQRLGLGASSPWQAGEETDYLLRALHQKLSLYFDPSLHVIHPRKAGQGRAQMNLLRSYGYGLGKVVALHRYSLAFKLRLLGGPIVRCLSYGLTTRYQRAGLECATLFGRLGGLLSR